MKPRIIYIILLGAIGLACEQSTSPISDYIIRAYDDGDPVVRAARDYVDPPYISKGQSNAGIVLMRRQSGDSTKGIYAGMAFDIRGDIAKVRTAIVNGTALTYREYDAGGDFIEISRYAYEPSAPVASGNNDSLAFSYTGFSFNPNVASDDFSGIVPVAPSFKNFVAPDTATTSQGFVLSYGNPVPGDSIEVRVEPCVTQNLSYPWKEWFLVPDSGRIVFSPADLAVPPQGDTTHFYVIFLQRRHYESLLSAHGIKIGILSTLDCDVNVPAKP
jgi:hypothetical protein